MIFEIFFYSKSGSLGKKYNLSYALREFATLKVVLELFRDVTWLAKMRVVVLKAEV